MYEVDEKVLADLDILEDYPKFYQRKQIQFTRLDDAASTSITAWIYFIKQFKPSLLNNTFYESYTNHGDHDLKYVDRYTRIKDYDHKGDVLQTD